MALYWMSFCNEERLILTIAGFLVSQAKRSGWTTSSVEAKTGEGKGGERGWNNIGRRERNGVNSISYIHSIKITTKYYNHLYMYAL